MTTLLLAYLTEIYAQFKTNIGFGEFHSFDTEPVVCCFEDGIVKKKMTGLKGEPGAMINAMIMSDSSSHIRSKSKK